MELHKTLLHRMGKRVLIVAKALGVVSCEPFGCQNLGVVDCHQGKKTAV